MVLERCKTTCNSTGSSTDDKLFNGLTFDFAFPRGEDGILEGPDDEGVEEGFYKRGDTVLVKSTTTTYPVILIC